MSRRRDPELARLCEGYRDARPPVPWLAFGVYSGDPAAAGPHGLDFLQATGQVPPLGMVVLPRAPDGCWYGRDRLFGQWVVWVEPVRLRLPGGWVPVRKVLEHRVEHRRRAAR